MAASPRPSWGKTPSRYPQNNHPPRRYNISRGGNLSPPEQPGEVSKGGAAAAAPPLAAERGGPGGRESKLSPDVLSLPFPHGKGRPPARTHKKSRSSPSKRNGPISSISTLPAKRYHPAYPHLPPLRPRPACAILKPQFLQRMALHAALLHSWPSAPSSGTCHESYIRYLLLPMGPPHPLSLPRFLSGLQMPKSLTIHPKRRCFHVPPQAHRHIRSHRLRKERAGHHTGPTLPRRGGLRRLPAGLSWSGPWHREGDRRRDGRRPPPPSGRG